MDNGEDARQRRQSFLDWVMAGKKEATPSTDSQESGHQAAGPNGPTEGEASPAIVSAGVGQPSVSLLSNVPQLLPAFQTGSPSTTAASSSPSSTSAQLSLANVQATPAVTTNVNFLCLPMNVDFLSMLPLMLQKQGSSTSNSSKIEEVKTDLKAAGTVNNLQQNEDKGTASGSSETDKERSERPSQNTDNEADLFIVDSPRSLSPPRPLSPPPALSPPRGNYWNEGGRSAYSRSSAGTSCGSAMCAPTSSRPSHHALKSRLSLKSAWTSEDVDDPPPKKKGPGRPKKDTNSKKAKQDGPMCNICKSCDRRDGFHSTECGHIFHQDCLENWFRASGQEGKIVRMCPACGKYFTDFIKLYL